MSQNWTASKKARENSEKPNTKTGKQREALHHHNAPYHAMLLTKDRWVGTTCPTSNLKYMWPSLLHTACGQAWRPEDFEPIHYECCVLTQYLMHCSVITTLENTSNCLTFVVGGGAATYLLQHWVKLQNPTPFTVRGGATEPYTVLCPWHHNSSLYLS